MDSRNFAVITLRDGGGIIINISNLRAQSTVCKSTSFTLLYRYEVGLQTQNAYLNQNGKPYIALECYPWLRSYFVLLSGMIMYDNEHEREENSLFETKPNLNQG